MMLVLAIVEIFSVILQRIFCDSTLKKKKIRRYTDYPIWYGEDILRSSTVLHMF